MLPISMGTAVGYSTRRKNFPSSASFKRNGSNGERAAEGAQKTYLEIKQPPGKPPAKVFGPVWTILYGWVTVIAINARPL